MVSVVFCRGVNPSVMLLLFCVPSVIPFLTAVIPAFTKYCEAQAGILYFMHAPDFDKPPTPSQEGAYALQLHLIFPLEAGNTSFLQNYTMKEMGTGFVKENHTLKGVVIVLFLIPPLERGLGGVAFSLQTIFYLLQNSFIELPNVFFNLFHCIITHSKYFIVSKS